jgi:hypothetical protein
MRIDTPHITGSFDLNGSVLGNLATLSTTGSNTFVGNQNVQGYISASALTGSIDFTNLTNSPTLVSGSSQVVNILSSLNTATASFTPRITNLESKSSSVDISISNINSVTSSFTPRITNLESKSSSVDISITNINSVTASNIARLNNLETKSASVDISVSNINTFTSSNANTSLNSKTGSYATTGSNTFFGTQTYSGSVYIVNDLIVQGSSSIQYISASSVSIGTNIVQLNTNQPAVRFGGLSVQDSGSAQGVTGSMFWDGCCNRWIYSNPSGVGYSGGVLMSGPRGSTLGNEPTLTCNYIAKSGGGDHLYDSCIIDDGTTVCVNANLKGTTACFSSAICGNSIDTGTLRYGDKTTNIGSLSYGSGYVTLETNNATALSFITNGQRRTTIATTGETCFACQICAPSFIGGTMSGTTIYGSTAVCSPIGLFSGCVGIGTITPASLLSAYNTTSTALLQLAMGTAENGTGGGNRGFDASFTSTKTSFTGTDSADQGYGYFPVTIVSGQTYTIHFKSSTTNGYLGTIITSTGTNFATSAVQTISLPTITDGALTSIRFTASAAASYIGFAGYRTSGTMSLTISEVSVLNGIPDIETGAMVAYKGIATNRINIQAPTTGCIPVLGCADCTTGLIVSNFDTNYGMLLGTLNTGVGWIQQARYDGTATPYSLSLNPNGGNVGIGTTTPGDLLHIEKYQAGGMGIVIRNSCGATSNTSMCSLISLQLVGAGQTGQIGVNLIAGKEGDYSSAGVRNAFFAIQTACSDSLCERMRISSDGFVGINCSNLSSRTFVVRSINSRAITAEFIEQAGQHSLYIQPNKNSTNHISSDYVSSNVYLPLSLSGRECTTDLVLSNGNVGIGTTSPSQKLEVVGNIYANEGASTAISVYNASSIRAKLSMTGNEGDLTLYGSSATAKIYLSAYYDSYFNGGAVFINHPSNVGEGKLRVSQDGSYWNTEIRHTYSTQYFMLFRYCLAGVGSIQGNGSNVSYYTTSDYRLKEDLKEVNGLEKIAAIKVYDFKWKNNNLRMDGVLAHELSNVLPYAVTGDKDALDKDGNINPQGVDYSKLAPVLVKAIQEQQCTICSQASMINILKSCIGIV